MATSKPSGRNATGDRAADDTTGKRSRRGKSNNLNTQRHFFSGMGLPLLGVLLLALLAPIKIEFPRPGTGETTTQAVTFVYPVVPPAVEWATSVAHRLLTTSLKPLADEDDASKMENTGTSIHHDVSQEQDSHHDSVDMITPAAIATAVLATSLATRTSNPNWEDVPQETMIQHWHPKHGWALADADTMKQRANMEVVKSPQLALHFIRDVLEVYPGDSEAFDFLNNHLHRVYPDGPHPLKNGKNHTNYFVKAMQNALNRDKAVQLSTWPDAPVYQVKSVIKKSDVTAFKQFAQRFKQVWKQNPPVVCFQHDDFVALPELKPGWRHPPHKGRGCLNAGYSRIVSSFLNFSKDASAISESSLIFHGQSPELDNLGLRIQKLTGLRDASGYAWQILEYPQGVSYHDHTDCNEHHTVTSKDARMATIIISLNAEDYEGGETVFPKLNVSAKPDSGSAVVFYNFGPGWGGHKCNRKTLHHSNRVTRGRKIVLQRWYTYPEHEYFKARPYREGGIAHDTPLPWHAHISCDYVTPQRHGGTNVSCRWYTSRVDNKWAVGPDGKG
eukprot:m.212919 g.212919  ORF g.212919 m.212919 type:complete len:558 (+) comp26293_c0_seq1:80-1753(+)